MTPEQKKLVSALVVTILVALLGTFGTYVAKLPAEMQTGALAIIAGLVHFVNAWGASEREDAAVSKRVEEIVKAER
jgi:di/tricarboxylate transporter